MKTRISSRLSVLITMLLFVALPVCSQQKADFEGAWKVVKHSFKETGKEIKFLFKNHLVLSKGNYIKMFPTKSKNFSIFVQKYSQTSENSLLLDSIELKIYKQGERLFIERKRQANETVVTELEKANPDVYPIKVITILQEGTTHTHPLCGIWKQTNCYAKDSTKCFFMENQHLIISGDSYIQISNLPGISGSYGDFKGDKGISSLDKGSKQIYYTFNDSKFLLANSKEGTIEEWTRTYQMPKHLKLFAKRLVPSIDVDPEFPGGFDECMHFLASQIKYPAACQEQGIAGRVIVSFTIDKTGKIQDAVRTDGSTNPQLVAEAIRVIKSMPAWKPGFKDGKPVNVRLSFPIQFSLK